MDFIFL